MHHAFEVHRRGQGRADGHRPCRAGLVEQALRHVPDALGHPLRALFGPGLLGDPPDHVALGINQGNAQASAAEVYGNDGFDDGHATFLLKLDPV